MRAAAGRRALARLRPRGAGALLLPTMTVAALLLAVKVDELRRRAVPGMFTAVARAQAQEHPPPADPLPPQPPAVQPDAAAQGQPADEAVTPGPAGAGSGRSAPLDPAALSPGEIELLQRLAERREALDERDRQLELRAAALEGAEAKLRAQIARLEQLRTEIQAEIERHTAAEEARLQSLIKIYEKMRPKDAAAIFDRLDMPVLLAVVAGMREAKSAPVIAAMNPETAERLTTELARRRRLVEE